MEEVDIAKGLSDAFVVGGAAVFLRYFLQYVKNATLNKQSGLTVIELLPEAYRKPMIQLIIFAVSIIFCIAYNVDFVYAVSGDRTILGPVFSGALQALMTMGLHNKVRTTEEIKKQIELANED